MNKEDNFIFEKLNQFLQYYTSSPLSLYTAAKFKELDEKKKIDGETFKRVLKLFEQLKKAYLDEINVEIENFNNKYEVEKKMQYMSDVIMISRIIKELEIPFETYKKMKRLSDVDSIDETGVKDQITNYLNEHLDTITKKNEELEKELEVLKEKNRIQFFINNN